MVIIRALGYLGVALFVAWVVGSWATADCVNDYAPTGGDGGLCGLGWLTAPPAFVLALVGAAIGGEVFVRRRRAARMRP